MANKRFIDFRVDTVAGNGSYLVGHDSTGTEFRIPVSSLLAGLPTPEVPTLKVQWSANGDTWTDQWSESSRYIRVKVGSNAPSGAMQIAYAEPLLVEKTYAELALMKQNGELIPGQKYRMTDYLTTTNGQHEYEESSAYGTMEYRSAEHPFDLVLTAVSQHEFDCRAQAVQSERDEDGYFAAANMQKWQIWYDFEGGLKYGWSNNKIDGTYFRHPALDEPGAAHPYAWKNRQYGNVVFTNCILPSTSDKYWTAADDTGAGSSIYSVGEHYGEIYRMIDENGNDCPYDFKNIQFKRYAIAEDTAYAKGYCLDSYMAAKLDIDMNWEDFEWLYTFTAVKDVDGMEVEYLDASMLADYNYPQLGSLPKQRNLIYGNVIKPYVLTWLNYPETEYAMLNDIVFVNRIERVYSNTWQDYYHKGFGCYSNKIDDNCYCMTIGHNCTSNLFGASCYCNLIGDSCYTNTFGVFFFTNKVSGTIRSVFGKNISNRLIAGYTGAALGQGLVFKASFTPTTERHPFEVNYWLEYAEGAALHCDRSIEEILYALRIGAMVMGAVSDFSAIVKNGYLYEDGQFYQDSSHTTLIRGNKNYIYKDLSDNTYYRYSPARFEEFSWGEGYANETGYYNERNGKFYEDSEFATEISGSEGTVYQDADSEKYYAYMDACYVECQAEDYFIESGLMQISDVSAKGTTMVVFQRLNTNSELTFTGRQLENLGELMDFWSMNLSRNKYEEKANKVQSIGKGSTDLYPSEAAVIAYIQANS